MESSDAPNRKTPLEELSKDDLIKKCNNLLIIAKKAKQAKDESSEELKKYKENEQKLSSDISALKEVVEAFNKKQNEFAEVQNKNKITEEKNSELQKEFKKLEEKYAAKITECSKLEQTLKKLSDKIYKLEISNSYNLEKLNVLRVTNGKLKNENQINMGKLKEHQQKEIDLKKKLQLTEEKYIKLEMTLKEFQGKYIEECKNHEELQEALAKLQNKNSSGRCSSRSSDSLKPVYENQEYDEMLEKYNDLLEKSKVSNLEIEKLNKKLNETENLVKLWSTKYDNLAKEQQDIPENWKDLVAENEKLQKDLIDSEKLKQVLMDKDTEFEKLVSELKEKSKLLLNQDDLVHQNIILNEKVQNMEVSHRKVVEDFNQCNISCQSLEAELQVENEGKIMALEELDKIKVLLNEKNQLVNEQHIENEKLKENVIKLEQSCNELNTKLCEMMKKHDNLMKEMTKNQLTSQNLDELKQKYISEISELSSAVQKKEVLLKETQEKYNENVMENRNLLKKLEQMVNESVELKKNYESALLEKNKLIEMCQSDKSTEEIFKKNISQLEQELMSLREENEVADKRYREMEQKLEESRIISELLKKEIDGKCDEYDAFKSEMEFYISKNDELNKKIVMKEQECSSYKNKCDEFSKAEKENINLIENLKKDLKTSTESLNIIQEKFKKLEEDLKKENIDNFYMFDNISLNDEQSKCILQDYVKVNNKVDSLRLLADLARTKAKLEMMIGKIDKEERTVRIDSLSSQVEEEFFVIGTESKNTDVSRLPKEKEEELRNKLSSLWRAVSEVKSLKAHINTEVKECFQSIRTDHIRIVQDITKSIADVFYNLQSGNSELLKEMNDMNQALKERGEVISRLEKVNESQHKELLEADTKITQLDSKLTENKTKLKQMFIDLEETKSEVENKDKTIKEMEEEIWKLKNSDTPAEALSSSTLSRVEEAARLMDVEESFEERYSKLKIFAAKLKKKVTEQQKQLEEERNRSVVKSNEFQTKIANFQSQIKSLMNIQAEYDRLQDTFEEEKNEKNKLRKILESANEKIESYKQEIDNLKKENDSFLNDKSSFANLRKKLSAQIISLKASVEEEKTKQIKLEKEIERLEYDKTLKEKKLEEEKEKHKSTIALFEKHKMETKNLSVLKLEIAEYEKSVGDLERKLAVKEENLKELNCLLENQMSQCKLYLDEITHLKSQLTQENERAIEASMQVQKFNEESSNRQIEIEEKQNEIGSLRTALEDKKKEMEEISLELAKIGQEKLRLEEKCKNIQDHCSREIHSLQDTVSNLQDSLNQRDLVLTELKKEFDAYKVRAQSVLRQSQKEMNQSKQRNVLEELEQLRSTSESLKSRLEESGLKMQKLVEENEVFQEEKNRLYSRIQELKNSLAELRAENQELKTSKQKDLESYNESLKLQKLQSETLAHCFQKKMEELEANHKKEVDELTKDNHQLQKQFQKIILSTSEKPSERREPNERKRSSSGFIPVKTDKEILDVMLLEREECEGSESVDSVSPQTGNNPNLIPLDQLLNSSENPELEEKRSPVQDSNHLIEKLEKSENRIKHLTVLLTDAETDCARLQHLNDVLKEEIRRNQRNIEREQHAQNFEYMKNVVLKFISLHNTDEKIRLVPVLNTILKLSPEEESILANAARGIVENSNRSWGSYLNIWPSAQ